VRLPPDYYTLRLLRARWRQIARLARYAKQSIDVLMAQPVEDLAMFDKALEGWLELEAKAVPA